jgi:CheY-like chemotaxis protein
MRILYVDDEPPMRDVIARLLSKLGCEVETADSGTAALARLSQAAPAFDVIVTDLSMPGMTGSQLARAVKAIAPDLPIIAYTGSSQRYLRIASDTKLFAAIVGKGEPSPALFEAIERAVASRTQ